jgi:hypothetical protein
MSKIPSGFSPREFVALRLASQDSYSFGNSRPFGTPNPRLRTSNSEILIGIPRPDHTFNWACSLVRLSDGLLIHRPGVQIPSGPSFIPDSPAIFYLHADRLLSSSFRRSFIRLTLRSSAPRAVARLSLSFPGRPVPEPLPRSFSHGGTLAVPVPVTMDIYLRFYTG